MSFTFRKRIKMLPGIYLNIGKNGVSTTIGPRGASINIGKKGAYLNTSIRGTGISNRLKLFSGNGGEQEHIIHEQDLPEIEEGEKELENQDETITSEGLKGLKEHLEECKKERGLILSEILQTQKTLTQLQNDLNEKKKNFLNACKNQAEKLETKIADTTNSILDLEHRLYKKENNTLSKFFTKQETIDNIKAEIESQNSLLNELRTEQENGKKHSDLSLLSDEEFKEIKFLSEIQNQKAELDQAKKDVGEYTAYLNELQTQYDNAKAHIDINSETELADQYAKVANAFHDLKDSNKIWDITSETKSGDLKSSAQTTVTRQEVKFSLKDIDFIESTEPAFYLENADGSHFYIYPAFILLMSHSGEFSLLDLKELDFKFVRQRFLEQKATIPSDSKIVDNVWFKVNKDGTPDLRFRGNYQTPVVHYGVLTFKVNNTMNEVYNISNFEVSQVFANEFMSYLALLKNENGGLGKSVITKQYFDTVKEFGDKLISFITKLKKDRQFINTIYQLQSIKEQPFSNSDELLSFFFIRDLVVCFSMTADITNLQSKEAFALLYIMAKNHGLQIEGYTNTHILYEPNLLKAYENMCNTLKPEIEKTTDANDAVFKFPLLLSVYDKDLQKEYLAELYRFASIVVKADGTVTKDEEAALKKILSLSEQHQSLQANSEQQNEVQQVKAIPPPSQQTLQEVLEELNSLIGLNAVKQEISTLINFIKIQKAREATGLKSSSLSYHIVFTGNPGTGKTTVARIVAEIYKNLGVLTQGQLVETDRSGLVAEYLGQTAVKVNKTVDTALNGVLFIDEAYSLVGENKDDFGKEAVATLIKRMEDNRDKLVVILAGYTNEMTSFINTNPGFKSRFNRYIVFDDYTPEELIAIYKFNCNKLEYTLTEDAEKKLLELFTFAFNNRDKSFGNGRFVRNIFEKTLERQSNRIASVPSLSKEILTTITLEDIPNK